MKELYLILQLDPLFEYFNNPLSIYSDYETARKELNRLTQNDEINNIHHYEYKIFPMQLNGDMTQMQTRLNLL
jgi:hypothetical protein